MVILAASQTKSVPSRQSSTSDDSDDDEPKNKGGKIIFYLKVVYKSLNFSFNSSSKKGSNTSTKIFNNEWK